MTKQLDFDITAREKIKNVIDKNFFVEAGAGSGKTTSLVGRMVNMIKSGIPVEEICTITYTKAAANEFYERFQKALAEEKDDENCQKALKKIDLAFMGTIDAFCNMIISEHPAAMKVPSSVENVSKEDFIDIYKNEFSKIRNGEYGEELAKLCQQYVKFNDYEEENFAYFLNDLMNKRTCEYVYDPVSDKDIEDFLANEGNKTIEALNYLANHTNCLIDIPENDEKIPHSNKDHKEAYNQLVTKINVLKKPWHNIPNVMSTLKKIRDIRLKKDITISAIGGDASKFLKEHCDKKGNIQYFEINQEEFLYTKLATLKFNVTMQFVANCIPKVAERLREQGKLEFFDYILYLRDALKEDAAKDSKLIKHISERHKYFLIDEFQDTNPLQIEIFFYLSSDNPQVDFTKCMPRGGSLFIVGDPKQSIYRFNGADVNSYLKIKELFKNPDVGEVLELSRNFRSTEELIKWFNNCFEDVLQENENQVAFTPIPEIDSGQKEEHFTGVYLYQSRNKHKDTVSIEEQDPYKVKEIILGIMSGGLKIREKDKDENGNEIYIYRKPEYKDFMLITPSKTKLGDYMQMFKKNNIPFRIEGKVLFNECPAYKLICKIYGAIAYPKNNTRVYDALSSEYLNLDNTQIYRLLNEENVKLDLTNNSNNKVIKAYVDLLDKVKELSISALYEYIMNEFDVFERVGVENMEYVYYGLELLKGKQNDGSLTSLQDAYDYLNNLLNNETDIERCMALSRDENKIHLANAHKVKGLEASIVMLIAGTKSTKKPANRIVRGDENKCYEFNIKKKEIPILTSCLYKDHCLFPDELKKEEEARDAEYDRLLYVAATRAKNVLIVRDSITSKGESAETYWKKAIDKISKDIHSVIGDVEIKYPTIKNITIDDLKDEEIFDNHEVIKPSYKTARPSKEVAHVLSEDYTPINKEDATLKGTLAHRLMEVLVLSKNKVDLNEVARSIVDEYCDDENYIKMLVKLGEDLRSGGFKQHNDCPQDILKELLENANEVYPEVPFSYMENGELWNGIIDVIYRKGNDWFIVDYKTNADPDDLDEKYKAQLDAYKKAFKETSGIDAKALIYHLEI